MTALIDVPGADLHAGDVVVDTAGAHLIDHLSEYPGRWCGGHARVAYGDQWQCTCPDGLVFHVQRAEEG